MSVNYLSLGEFFCGPGGLAHGAITAFSRNNDAELRIKHRWANDIDPSSCETYRLNIAGDLNCPSVICVDVHKVDVTRLDPIDIFAYGFPCNDFSIVGEHKGLDGDYGGLYKTGVNVLNFHKPRIFVAENVGGINSANDGNAFQKILQDLQNAGEGYNLTVNLYKSEEYGIAQTRHRYVIVGFAKETGLHFRVPAPTHLNNPVPVKNVLDNIPITAFNNEPTRMSKKTVERLQHIKPGQNAWNADLPDHLKLNVKGAKLSQIYRRLHPDKPAYTITGSGGGGTHGYHFDEPRALTNRERARIQTFPDDYRFCGSKEQVRKQIGMAVPPHLANIIFTAILNTLNGVDYPSIEPSYKHHLPIQQELFPLD